MIFILATPCSYGHVVEAAWDEGAEGTFADRLGDNEGLNHPAVVGECYHVVIHISRSRQPGNAEVVITAGIVHRYITHTGRDCDLKGGRKFKRKTQLKVWVICRGQPKQWAQEIGSDSLRGQGITGISLQLLEAGCSYARRPIKLAMQGGLWDAS